MHILSWDVGIINLAFCLIDYNSVTKKFKIIDWDVINLTERDKMKCFHCNANQIKFLFCSVFLVSQNRRS